MQKLLFIFTLLVFLQIPELAKAADSTQAKKSIEAGIGMYGYRGDLSSSFAYYNAGVHVGLLFHKSKRFNGRMYFFLSSISAGNANYTFLKEDGTQATPNSFFNTALFGFGYDLSLLLYEYKQFKLQFSQGIGLLRFSPKDQQKIKLDDQFETRAEGETYGPIAFSLPTQFSLTYSPVLPISFSLRMGFQNSMSDYLDNISDWGARKKKDNIMFYRFSIILPLKS
jgi:hypothetical protein